MDAAKQLLSGSRAYLQQSREATRAILGNHRVTAWQEINLDNYLPVFLALDLPPRLREARSQYPQVAKEILTAIGRLENEIGNLEADIIAKSITPDKALLQAQALADKCRLHVADNLAAIGAHSQLLVEADLFLRQKLTLQDLLPLAREEMGHKSDLFDAGLDIFKLINSEKINPDDPQNIHDFFEEATRMESRLRAIPLDELRNLSLEIVLHQIDLALDCAAEIKNFIDFCTTNMMAELSSFTLLKQRLKEMKEQPLLELLQTLNKITPALGKQVLAFTYKKQVKEALLQIADDLELLLAFHLGVKNELLAELPQQLRAPGSRINPQTFAAEKSHYFFSGFAGIIRVIKFFFTSLQGEPALNKEELQTLLEGILQECDGYFGSSSEELYALQSFIDGRLCKFGKPFPYQDLFRLARTALGEYGNRLENYVEQFKVKPPRHTGQKQPVAIGQLAELIKKRKENIQFFLENNHSL